MGSLLGGRGVGRWRRGRWRAFLWLASSKTYGPSWPAVASLMDAGTMYDATSCVEFLLWAG
jgi:hypothetical protein